MRPRCGQFVWIVLLVATIFDAAPVRGQIWKQSVPTSRGSASGDNRSTWASDNTRAANGSQETRVPRVANAGRQQLANADASGYAMTQESGPWLIVAASFSGNGAEKQAHDLAAELRDSFHLQAYVHEMDFKFRDDSENDGTYGSSTRRRFRRGDEARELAVLIGDFASIDGPDAQQMLSRVKTMEPNALNVDEDQSAQSMAQVRRLQDAVMEKIGKERKRGPMGQAFFTRNPLLPREYFVPKGVDAFIAKMNEGVEHSLLDCPGRRTIQVATFRGKTILQTSAKDDAASKSFWSGHKKDDKNPLVQAAENAHLLAKELRSHGFDAYEFHDRTESIVTIGSFAQTTQQLPDGRVVALPEVQKIIQTFDAGFDTPADPLSPIGNDSRTQRLVEEREREVSARLNNQQAQIVPGLNPKHVKILSGRGKNVKVERIIPMDIHPQVIDVPKRSVSSAYAG
jgi:hypothetical protein